MTTFFDGKIIRQGFRFIGSDTAGFLEASEALLDRLLLPVQRTWQVTSTKSVEIVERSYGCWQLFKTWSLEWGRPLKPRPPLKVCCGCLEVWNSPAEPCVKLWILTGELTKTFHDAHCRAAVPWYVDRLRFKLWATRKHVPTAKTLKIGLTRPKSPRSWGEIVGGVEEDCQEHYGVLCIGQSRWCNGRRVNRRLLLCGWPCRTSSCS